MKPRQANLVAGDMLTNVYEVGKVYENIYQVKFY